MSIVLPGVRQALDPGWARNRLWRSAKSVPSLDLNFASSKSLVDSTSGKSLITFTRASTGTYVGSDGLLQSAVTNLLLRSEEFDNASWNKIGGGTGSTPVVNANAAIAPDGTTTADQVVLALNGGTTVNDSSYITQSYQSTSGLFYTVSIWLRTISENVTIALDVDSNTSNLVTVTPFWQRFSFGRAGSTTGSRTVRFGIRGTFTTATDSATFYAWGAQLEQSSTVGDYVPTTSVINSAPRFDHNPTTSESLGLLVEEARTNLIATSEALVNVTGASILNNTTTAPDGLVTADTLIEDTSTGTHSVNTASIIWAGNTTYTFTIFLKANTRTQLTIQLGTASNWVNNQRSATFDLSTGTVITTSGSSITASIEPFLNSWYRCRITAATVAVPVPSTVQMQMYVSGSASYTGNGTSGLFFWGAQLEAGAFPTSYIPTTTATVTRALDVASITGAAFSSFYNQTEGTIYGRYAERAFSVTHQVVTVSNGTNSERISIAINTSNILDVAVISGGTDTFVGNTPTLTAQEYQIGFGYKTDDSGVSANGSAITVDSAVTLPTVSQLDIGARGSSQILNSTIKRLTYWPVRLANPTLQSITTP